MSIFTMCFGRRKAPTPASIKQPDSDFSYIKAPQGSFDIPGKEEYTPAQEAETVVRMLSTMPRKKSKDPKPDPHNPLYHRMSNYDCLAELLDGLATMCVSKPRQETVAAGLQLNYAEKKLTFVLTVDEDVGLKTVSHARDILRGVQELGHEFAKFRISTLAAKKATRAGSQPSEGESKSDSRATSSELAWEDLPQELRDVHSRWIGKAYRFSIAKCKQRLQKPFTVGKTQVTQIDHFIEMIDAIPTMQNEGTIIPHFREVVVALKLVRKILSTPDSHPGYLGDQAMSDLDNSLWYAACQVEDIFKNGGWKYVLAKLLGKFSPGAESKWFPFFIP